MTSKRLFRVHWIEINRLGKVVNVSSVYAKNMIGACNQIQKRDGFIDILSIKLNGVIDRKHLSITTVEEYDNNER